LDREEIISLIKKLMEEGNSILSDIEQLQSVCKHNEGYDVKFNQGTNNVRCICKICGSVIGYPTEGELKDNGFI
jgi:ribosomal protein S27E